jgi:succinate dehydrogenase / fumarate reductase flavoprotein subunit
MRIYPAPHYTMGGLWVDYNLMTTIPGLYALGEANFSDHGANRLGASALMQGLADGYFIIPSTIGDYLANRLSEKVSTAAPEYAAAVQGVQERARQLLGIRGKRTVHEFHRELGHIVWNNCGMARNEKGLTQALSDIAALREAYYREVSVPGSDADLNQALEKAGRVADYFELADVMCRDALTRRESCGCHFREEYKTATDDTQRDDENFCHVAAWEFAGDGKEPIRNVEPLVFERVKLAQRNYK